ncbi:MAG: hypothetical protein LQ348_003080 [Seirophora lacunosa]|nr:MAG: hypothetical protein LQ348_003080 [Seirophora lacunosa]
MAALLALLIRRSSKIEVPDDIDGRITSASATLRQMLRSWDSTTSDNIGFELLLPAHLEMLEKYSLSYSFPARPRLMDLYEQRLQREKPESLYGSNPSTLLHCLEGMIGKIDFDRLAHHKAHGGMLCSPSSTAAYLMNTSIWDREAEAYIWNSMPDCGAVEVNPTSLFEITWALMALVEAFPMDAILSLEMNRIAESLENVFHSQKGLAACAPGVHDEADTTGSMIYILNFLGRNVTPDAMINRYESSDKFRYLAIERTPSSSTNAHALKGPLHVSNRSENACQIIKVATYITDCWWRGDTFDKWSMTPQYAKMLFSQSLVMLLRQWEHGQLPEIQIPLITEKILPVLFGIAVDTLQQQNEDGSWGFRSREITAYAVLCLSAAAPLPICDCLRSSIEHAIKDGKAFLLRQTNDWSKPDFVWRSKAAYGLGVVAEAYTLAAMRISPYDHSFGKNIEDICQIAKPSLGTFQEISHLPFFAEMPDWLVSACIVEAYLRLPVFDRARQAVITQGAVKQQRHFNIVPFAFIASSRSKGAFMTADMNGEFMVMCALVYEVDHYIEEVIGGLKGVEVQEVRNFVHEVFEEACLHPPTECQPKGVSKHQEPESKQLHHLDGIKTRLRRGISWVLNSQRVLSSSKYDQVVLRRELKAFYMGQIRSVYESASLATSRTPQHPVNLLQEPYHNWVHTTSSSHASGLLTFAFLTCLLGASMDGQDCFRSAVAKYLAQDLSMHLSSLIRMENDIGSVIRDRKENNLNSVDFPEFDTTDQEDDLESRIEQLKGLAAYERECAKNALAKLIQMDVDERVVWALKAYCNAVDLYGEIYAMQDVTPSLARCS